MAEGFVLNIDNAFLKRLESADKKIQQLGTSSEHIEKRIIEAFTNMGQKGVGAFTRKLHEAQEKLNALGTKGVDIKLNVDSKSIDDLKKQISGLGTSVNVTGAVSGVGSTQDLTTLLSNIIKAGEVLSKIKSGKIGGTGGSDTTSKSDDELAKSVKHWEKLQEEVVKYEKELDNVNKKLAITEQIRKNIASGKGGSYNPKEYQDDIARANELKGIIDKHKEEQRIIIEKNKQLAETFNLQKELKNVTPQKPDIELLRLNEQLSEQEKKSLELETQKTKELKEYESLLVRINQLKQEQDNITKIKNTSKDSDVVAQADQQQQRVDKALIDANKRRVELEKKLGSDVLDAQHKAGKKELEYLRKREQDKIKEWQRTARRYLDIQRKLEERKRGTAEGALSYSQNEAKTIQQKIQAINYLKKAQQGLDVTSDEGKKKFRELANAIRRGENELKRYGVQMGNIRNESNKLFNLSGQLGRALSLMFSVSQISQYVSKMVNVRKEMELQQRSLQVLLQSKEDANKLWNQTLDLAVKSPFRVKELVTYTKQLAAYRIESDKLFETNKMLADVSAGLGVDMQRLILAFGQVRSASFLRGTELRQFTEAGIPMLEQLSQYFSELEGRAVSVADVFDRISKRKVTFSDVEKVFQKMTGAGGVFFNMQEELSNTTAGMISNLQDSIDLMFNEMGEKNDVFVKGAIKAVKSLVDNWEIVGNVMKGILITLLAYKASVMDVDKMVGNIKDKLENIKNIPTNFTKGNAVMLALTAIIALASKAFAEWKRYDKEVKDVKKAHADLIKSVKEVELGMAELFNKTENLDEYKGKLMELVNIADSKYNIDIDFDIKNLENIDQVSKKFDDLKAKILSFNELSLQFGIDFVKADDRGWGWFQNFLGKDLSQFNEAQKNIQSVFYKIRTSLSKELKALYEGKDVPNFSEEILKNLGAQKVDESDYEYLQRQLKGIKSITDEYEKLQQQYYKTNNEYDLTAFSNFTKIFSANDIDKIERLVKKYNKALGEATTELTSFYQTTNDDVELLIFDLTKLEYTSEKMSENLSNAIFTALKNVQTEKGIDDLVFTEMLAQAEDYYTQLTGYEINLLPKPDPKQEDITLKEWQKAYNDFVDQYSKEVKEANRKIEGFDPVSFSAIKINEDLQSVSKTQEQVLKEVEEALDAREKAIKQYENAAEAAKSNIDLNALKKDRDLLKQLWEWLGGTEDDKGGENKAVQRIKDQIALIKQLYDEYQKRSEKMGATEAYKGVKESFTDAAKELGLELGKIDFTNLAGINKAFEGLKEKAQQAGAKAVQALAKAMGESNVEIDLMFYMADKDKFERQIKDMFSNYETSLELDKLNIPQTFAEQFFSLDSISLDYIKNKLKERLAEIEGEELSSSLINIDALSEEQKKSLELQREGFKEEREYIQDQQDKIAEMERKAQEERLKTYLTYARNAIGEKAKIKVEEYNKLAEVDKMFDEIAKKREGGKLTSEDEARKKQIKEAISTETKGKIQKFEWEEFQKTETFMSIMNDLESTSSNLLSQMIDKLKQYKDEWADMPLEDVKRITEAIEKLEMQQAILSPKDTKDKFKELIGGKSPREYVAEQQSELFKNEGKLSDVNEQIAQIEHYIALLEEGKEISDEEITVLKDKYELGNINLETLRGVLGTEEDLENSLRKQAKDLKNQVDKNKNNLTLAKQYVNALKEQVNRIQQVQKAVGMVYDGYTAILDAAKALGKDTDNLELFGSAVMDSFSLIANMVVLQAELNAASVGATAFGTAMNAALGIIGWIVMGIQIVSKIITAIAKNKDNNLVEQIEVAQRQVEKLQKEYDKLSEAIDKAYSADDLRQYNKELEQTTRLLIEQQKSAIAAQEQRKGANTQGSDNWKELQEMYDELEEMENQLIETQEQIFSKLTGGVIDDVLSASNSFVDAWLDAFKETGSGLSGLEDNFKDMFNNIIKQQASMLISEQFVAQWQEQLRKLADNGLTTSEVESWRDMVENDLPALNDLLETFYSGFSDIADSGELSGLQKGIQGITESQADILASYANSCRFLLTSIDTTLTNLASSVMASSTRGSNPMLSELQSQTGLLKSIDAKLASVIKAGYRNGGSCIKVEI